MARGQAPMPTTLTLDRAAADINGASNANYSDLIADLGVHTMRKLVLLFITLFVSLVPPAEAQLGFIEVVVGGTVLLDKAGKELRESIDRAQAAGHALIAHADDAAKARLEQVDEIAQKAIREAIGKGEAAALKILEKASDDITALEKAFVADLQKLIWQAECAGRKLAIEDLKEACGGLCRLLSTHQIKLTPPIRSEKSRSWYSGCFWWCPDPYIVRITEPFGQTYISVRDLMEGSMSAATEGTPAHQIVATYEYLSVFALKTSCFYSGSTGIWIDEYATYRAKASKWRALARITVK
jgi:hypothetical protein